MIKPNMKVGEHFTEGTLEYEVLVVNEDGSYISKLIGHIKEQPEQPVAEEKAVVVEEKPKRTTTAKRTTTKK